MTDFTNMVDKLNAIHHEQEYDKPETPAGVTSAVAEKAAMKNVLENFYSVVDEGKRPASKTANAPAKNHKFKDHMKGTEKIPNKISVLKSKSGGGPKHPIKKLVGSDVNFKEKALEEMYSEDFKEFFTEISRNDQEDRVQQRTQQDYQGHKADKIFNTLVSKGFSEELARAMSFRIADGVSYIQALNDLFAK